MPKPFHFKLERVLDYRTQLEDQAKSELARAQHAFDEQAAVVDDLLSRQAAHLASEAESRKSANDMWLWRQYKEALERDVADARYRLSELELKLHDSREKAVARSRDRKLLEKLRETQARKHHEEESAREEKENDEMATLRHQSQDF
ncbi:flagellar export protein FliJ [Pseudodesulfovibrio cashew]|uniref:Flagellar FliJ protein n=1 Tax=Pseudodesulfovibrio cashew TaxID=2678688 RepID=A0A6I6JBD5_9BACT|nr:flagellar export protein FliJ [Pseudodesulfovibrio cashew]QGY40086.1 flagellar export protein FliJ [Pseudodesulfovibrio cashew]